MPALYRVQLSADERRGLQALTRGGTTKARRLIRARALLLADDNRPDYLIADAVGLSRRSIVRLRRRAVEDGVWAALEDRPRPGGQPKLDPDQHARLVALACSEPPAGRTHWSLQLLADRLVELGVVEAVSDETVRRTLKKTSSNPGRPSSGVSPP